jgi:Tol biopolymer transport system component/imidazolonepropionase-like amidohydrolase
LDRVPAALTLVLLSACASSPSGQQHATSAQPATDAVRFEAREGTRLGFDLSPDGRTIVLDLLGQLWLLPAEGGDARPLTDAVRDTAEDLTPAFSPDGAWVVFQSDRPAGRSLWLVPSAGGAPRRLTSSRIGYFIHAAPAWSPDGREVIHAAGPGLVRVDALTGEERLLRLDSVPPPESHAWYASRPGFPAWAPGGGRVAFVHAQGGGGIWEVDGDGRELRRLTPEGVRAAGPAYSPDGRRLAFFARDSAGRNQLWIQELAGDSARQLTNHNEVITLRARWTPDGTAVLYSAEGGLWRVGVTGGEPEPIPFRAEVRLERRRAPLLEVRFPEPGTERVARGFSALALAPDGERIALVALDSLWIWRPGSAARAIAALPAPVDGLTWSADGREVAWSQMEAWESSHLFAADVGSGAVRRLTSLPGWSHGPLWSPDGRWIAFVQGGRLRLIDARGPLVQAAEQTRDLGEVQLAWGTLAWSPGSDALLAAHLPIQDLQTDSVRAVWIPLEGERRQVDRMPVAPAHLHLRSDGRAVWVENNLLWQAEFDGSAGLRTEPVPLSEEAAIEARHGADGSILYLSTDGLRIRDPRGAVRGLGWPLTFRTPAAPPPLLIRNVRIIDGTGRPPSAPADVALRNGRIAQIAAAGTLTPPDGGEVLDGGGRVLLPGLIDLHAHVWSDLNLPAWLHAGTTTIRDIASQRLHLSDLRHTLERGIREGPRIVYAGGMFHGGSGHTTLADQMVSEAGAVRRGMAIMAGLGVQYVKERGMSDWWGTVNVVHEAHRHGIPVSGHCADPLPVVAAGMDGREHAADCFRDRVGLPRQDFLGLHREAGIWIVPTAGLRSTGLFIAAEPSLLESPDVAPFLTPQQRAWYPAEVPEAARATMTAVTRRWGEATLRYQRAGVLLGAGTDNQFPLGVHLELEALVAAGLTPLEAIVAATGNAARVLNAPEIGVVEEGRWADLLILEADPLADIRNARRIWRLIQGGRVVDREALRRTGIH